MGYKKCEILRESRTFYNKPDLIQLIGSILKHQNKIVRLSKAKSLAILQL